MPMPERKKIVIFESHEILREALKMLLSSAPDIEVVGEAKHGLDAVRSLESHKPDLILMDLSMPGMHGVGAIMDIKRQNPNTKILVLSVYNSEEYILSALRAGADGYILMDDTQSELMSAIESIFSGGSYISPGRKS
jgi:DNA-binding NarL/FixJ family response regulator